MGMGRSKTITAKAVPKQQLKNRVFITRKENIGASDFAAKLDVRTFFGEFSFQLLIDV